MKTLIKLLIVVLVLAAIFGAAYSVLNPILKDLGVELGDIFKDETTKTPDDKKEPVECTHQVSEWVSKDSVYHEGLCTVKDCGATVKDKHTYKKAFYQSLDFEYHEKTCDNCDYVVKEPHKYVNGVCACAFLEPDNSETGNEGSTTHTEHNYEVYVRQTTTSHIMKCSIDGCTSTKSFDHQFGAEKVVTAASCETSGKKQSTCSVCSFVKTITTAPIGHSYNENGVCSRCDYCKHLYKDSCSEYSSITESGHNVMITEYCTVCDDIIFVSSVATKAHTFGKSLYGNYEYSKHELLKTCSGCGYTVVSYENHDFYGSGSYVDEDGYAHCGCGCMRH